MRCSKIMKPISTVLLLFLIACGSNNGNKNNITTPTPTLNLLPAAANIALGKSATFTVTTTNTDFTVTGGGCSKNNSTTVVCTPTSVGTHELTVTATADTTLTRKATITVVEVAIALASNSDESEIMVGESKVFTVTATNTEYDMSVEDESGCVINENNTNEIICTPTASGDYNLVVTAKADTSKTAKATFSAYEVGISIAPSQAVIVLGYSETFNVATVRTDFDMDVDSAAGCVVSGNEIICTPTAAGEYNLTVTSKVDPTKTMTSDITVNEVGITIDPTTKSITAGEAAVFTVTAVNTDFTMTVDEVAGCVRDGAAITCTPTADGTYELTVKATADDTKTMTAVITAVPAGPKEIEGMVFVKAGKFRLGCTAETYPTYTSGCSSNARPQYEVTLTKSFYIGQTEVTQNQWQSVLDAIPGGDTILENVLANQAFPNDAENPDRPVTNLSWDDAQYFITKLNEQTNLTYRLPTNAEWEYAAQDGNEIQKYAFSGSDIIENVAWFGGNFLDANAGQMTHSVKTKDPNELSLYDMTGNVAEWVYDFFSNNYSGAESIDPVGPDSHMFNWRTIRGGNFDNTLVTSVITTRGSAAQTSSSSARGFRLAMTAPEP